MRVRAGVGDGEDQRGAGDLGSGRGSARQRRRRDCRNAAARGPRTASAALTASRPTRWWRCRRSVLARILLDVGVERAGVAADALLERIRRAAASAAVEIVDHRRPRALGVQRPRARAVGRIADHALGGRKIGDGNGGLVAGDVEAARGEVLPVVAGVDQASRRRRCRRPPSVLRLQCPVVLSQVAGWPLTVTERVTGSAVPFSDVLVVVVCRKSPDHRQVLVIVKAVCGICEQDVGRSG